jgi:phospholipid/cholesterol/gamma-HCH transport system substrate-binding protein
MIGWESVRSLLVIGACAALTATGCTFNGVNSLPLPGAVGRGPGANVYHVEIANVGTLDSNSPVMINDVVVGSVGQMTVKDWHANVEVSVNPDIVVPANAVATVGQTSLLGSMHLQLNPPLGEAPSGRLQPGATIPLNRSSAYPSTEQTLASLSAVANAGGLGQIGDIIHNFNAALSGRQGEVRELITHLDNFVVVLNDQRDNIVASIDGLNRLSATFAGQRDVITNALNRIPTALDVLIRERPRITTALEKLGNLSDIATRLVNDSQADLVKNLQNLEPTIKTLADLGPDLDTVLARLPIFPYSQSFIDRAVRGDYQNLFLDIDLTVPRLKRTMFLGTRWGQVGAPLVPAPGDPWYLNYTYDPLNAGVNPPPPDAAPGLPPPDAAPGPPPALPPGVTPMPVSPPPLAAPAAPTSQIFSGPYSSPDPGAASPGGPTGAAPAPGGG